MTSVHRPEGPIKTVPDWLTFRTQAQPVEALEALRPLFGTLAPLLRLTPLERGKDGFQQAAAIHLGQDYVFGRMDFGGESQRGWVRVAMTGVACENVRDWDAVAEVEALPAAEIRRLDLALTTWRGEVTHERVVQAHADGLFRAGVHGRPPELRQITSSDPMAGRTCYVGSRECDKFFRAYEKGLEWRAKGGGTLTHVDGFPVEDIYRCEVELKAKTGPVPWEAIERRDQYFAGCYPFLAQLLPGVEADILLRRPERRPALEVERVEALIRRQYGTHLRTLLAVYHGDIGEVFSRVCAREMNADMLAAGVLMREALEGSGA